MNDITSVDSSFDPNDNFPRDQNMEILAFERRFSKVSNSTSQSYTKLPEINGNSDKTLANTDDNNNTNDNLETSRLSENGLIGEEFQSPRVRIEFNQAAKIEEPTRDLFDEDENLDNAPISDNIEQLDFSKITKSPEAPKSARSANSRASNDEDGSIVVPKTPDEALKLEVNKSENKENLIAADFEGQKL